MADSGPPPPGPGLEVSIAEYASKTSHCINQLRRFPSAATGNRHTASFPSADARPEETISDHEHRARPRATDFPAVRHETWLPPFPCRLRVEETKSCDHRTAGDIPAEADLDETACPDVHHLLDSTAVDEEESENANSNDHEIEIWTGIQNETDCDHDLEIRIESDRHDVAVRDQDDTMRLRTRMLQQSEADQTPQADRYVPAPIRPWS